jgi:hypothetical protein
MGILKFIRDLIIYPFDADKKNNRFSIFLEALLKNYHIIRESVPFEDTDSIVHNKIIAILHLVQNNALDITL